MSAVLEVEDRTAHADAILALNQLCNPAGTHGFSRSDLVALGGMNLCLAVLSDPASSSAAKEQSAKLLRSLCTNDKLAQDAAAAIGVVPVVVELIARRGPQVHTGVTPGLRLWLTCALRVATSASALALDAAREAGAVEALTHWTSSSPTADLRDAATAALANFSAAPASGNTGPRAMTWGAGRDGGVPEVDLGGSIYVPSGTGSSQDAGTKSQWYTQYPVWASGVATRGIGGHAMPWAVKDHRGRLLQG